MGRNVQSSVVVTIRFHFDFFRVKTHSYDLSKLNKMLCSGLTEWALFAESLSDAEVIFSIQEYAVQG